MTPSFYSLLGLLAIFSSTVVTVAAVTLPSGETVDQYSYQLGNGSTQQVLALMLVVMVIAVMVLAGGVWNLFQKIIITQAEAHAARDLRDTEYQKALHRFSEVIEKNTMITARCHEVTVINRHMGGGVL